MSSADPGGVQGKGPSAGGKPKNPWLLLGKQRPGQPPLHEGEMPVMNSVQMSLIVAPTILFAVATVAVFCRVYSRRVKGQKFGMDDALCIFALILGYVQQATVLILVLGGGLALPVLSLSLPTITEFLKALMANVVIYITNVAVLQLAVIAFYIRLFGVQKSYRILCYVVIGLVIAWGLQGVGTRIFACGANVYKAVNIVDTSIPGTCADEGAICAATAVSHVILDGSIILMPVPMVWKLQMSTFNKVVVTLVLCSGVFATVCAILRMHCMINLYTENPQDPTMALGLSTLYQSLEVPIGLICICTPTFAPLWAKVSESRIGYYAKRLLSSRGTAHPSTAKTADSYGSKEPFQKSYQAAKRSNPSSYNDPKEEVVCTCPVHGYPNNAFPYAGQQPQHPYAGQHPQHPNGRIAVVQHWDVERS